MEKRRKQSSLGTVGSNFDAEAGVIEVDGEDSKKLKSLSTFSIIAIFLGLIVLIYCLYVVISGRSSVVHLSEDVMRPHIHVINNVPLTNIVKESANTITVEKLVDSSHRVNLSTSNIEENIGTFKQQSPVVTRSLSELQGTVDNLIEEIRSLKKSGTVIETDEHAQKLVRELQDQLRQLIPMKYGRGPYFAEMKLKFPRSMPDFETEGEDGTIIIQLAPIELVPYSVYYQIESMRQWKGGAFHRVAPHVLQAMVNNDDIKRLAFQEYNPEYPHKPMTMGYAGRPGGPEFYISVQDNSENHGPGSQGSATEADSCFGKIFIGDRVVDRIKKQPGKTPGAGFIDKPSNFIKIISMRLLSEQETAQFEF